ncbi:hypothetical protein LP419_39720 [Massilia sp. H-1]|nr:hypothetical protein LP419_39720 [Massilia sp. H-1]
MIGGLVEGQDYYLIKRADGKFSLATTLANAQANIAINVSLDTVDDANGITGVGHRFSVFVYDTDPTNDITAAAFNTPVSPGLYAFLFPHAEFKGTTPVQAVPEVMNVMGANVTLVASDGSGSIGRSAPSKVVSLVGGFDALSNENKVLMATANASDVYGRQYATYRYVGPQGADGTNLAAQNFGNGANWQKITYVATGPSKAAPINQVVANNGYVLVEFNANSYGLYQFKGATGSLNLAGENYSDLSRWTKVVANRATDDSSSGALFQGQIVLNKFKLERVAIQLQDDVDLQMTGQINATADGSIAIKRRQPRHRHRACRCRHSAQGQWQHHRHGRQRLCRHRRLRRPDHRRQRRGARRQSGQPDAHRHVRYEQIVRGCGR